MSNVFRGSWIPATDAENCELFICPECGEQVYMKRGQATYPSCPFCLTDLPEAEEFETPEELSNAKRGNKGCTGLTYTNGTEEHAEYCAKRRKRYAENREQAREYQREYYRKNKERILSNQRVNYIYNKEKRLEYQRQYRAAHKDELNESAKEWRRNNPDKVREYQIRARGKPMREVTAHIMGIPVEDVPETGFKFGKGVTT